MDKANLIIGDIDEYYCTHISDTEKRIAVWISENGQERLLARFHTVKEAEDFINGVD
jgi:hypothetical protein